MRNPDSEMSLKRKKSSRSASNSSPLRWKAIWQLWALVLAVVVLMFFFIQTGRLLSDPLTESTVLEKKDRDTGNFSGVENVLMRDKGLQQKVGRPNKLGNLDMPTRRVRGGVEPCLKLLPMEEIAQLEFPQQDVGPIQDIHYITAMEPQNQHSPGDILFTGNQTMVERDDSFKIHDGMHVHCGFYSQHSGFDIEQGDKDFMNKCKAVVITCIFGGGDDLYQPIGWSNASLSKVCFVAFWDEITLEHMINTKRFEVGSRTVGIWRIVIVRNLPFSDQRRNGKIPKMLGHRLFPQARYSIWVDSKYQFRRDPIGVFHSLLWQPGKVLAISEHGARSCVYKEGQMVISKHKALPEEVAIQLEQYHSEGFPENARFEGHKALAEASIIVREHNPLTNLFMCIWFNEVVHFTARDQLSFPYVLSRFKLLHVNMIPVCTRKSLVNSLGHKQKVKPLDSAHFEED